MLLCDFHSVNNCYMQISTKLTMDFGKGYVYENTITVIFSDPFNARLISQFMMCLCIYAEISFAVLVLLLILLTDSLHDSIRLTFPALRKAPNCTANVYTTFRFLYCYFLAEKLYLLAFCIGCINKIHVSSKSFFRVLIPWR